VLRCVAVAQTNCTDGCSTPPPEFPDMRSLFRRTSHLLGDVDVFKLLSSAAEESNIDITCDCAAQVRIAALRLHCMCMCVIARSLPL